MARCGALAQAVGAAFGRLEGVSAMTTWIFGGFAAVLWIFAIWLWRSRSNSNFQRSDFEIRHPDMGKEHEALRKTNDDAAIEAWYRKQTKRWNLVDWLHHCYADFLRHHGRNDEANGLLKSFIARARRLEDAYRREAPVERMFLVRNLRDDKRVDEAERTAEQALARPHAHPHTAIMYAQIARDRGDHAEAARRFLLALERFPDEVEAADGAVKAMLAQGLAVEAEEMVRRQMREFPRGHGLAILYARLAQDRGDLEEAAVRWDYVREQFVFREEAYTEGVEVLRKLGREAEADAVLASRPRDISELKL